MERSDDPLLDDNCPTVMNAGQEDSDGDGDGDACNDDTDGDEWADALDNCPTVVNAGQEDTDGDGFGNACEDIDEGGVGDGVERSNNPLLDDNCPTVVNAGQEDSNGDLIGDACEACDSGDGDGWPDNQDNCPGTPNGLSGGTCVEGAVRTCHSNEECDLEPEDGLGVCSLAQEDTDGDGVGDACNDADDTDGDEWADVLDNCLEKANRNQLDTNSDGIGNQCDADFDNSGNVGVPDFIMLGNAWGATPGDAAYDPDIDMDDDDADRGIIGTPEFLLLSNSWGQAPGPGLPGCDGKLPPLPACPVP